MRLLFSILLITTFCYAGAQYSVSEDQIAPDFEFTSEEGKVMSLHDFKGKVVYISFWASWCKPCIEGFIKYENTRRSLDSLGVIILNVSIDEDKTKWKEALINYPIVGMNVHAKDITEIKRIYELYSIPAYEIVNKRGHFIYLSDDPNRTVIGEFSKFLSE